MENKGQSGFKIQNIILLEVNFKRINEVKFGDDLDNNLNINIEVNLAGDIVNVVETANFVQKNNDGIEQVIIMVKMIGIFQREGDAAISDMDKFGQINGAAIIFPFIREHISNLSLKACIPAIMLPPVNFVSLYERRKK